MKLESLRTALTTQKDKAVAFGRKKYDAAKPKVTDAFDSAKQRAQKIIDDSKRIQAAQDRALRLQKQAEQGIASARQTIQYVQENHSVKAIGKAAKATGHAVKTVGETARKASQPHVDTAKAYVSRKAPMVGNFVAAKAHDAGNFVGAQATQLVDKVEAKVLDIASDKLLNTLEKPQTWTDLRVKTATRLHERMDKATDPLQTPQQIMKVEFNVDEMNGLKKVGAEAGVYAMDSLTRVSGWVTASFLSMALGLNAKGQTPISAEQTSHIIAAKVTIPAIRGTGKAMGTIYERAKDAFHAHFTPLPPVTQES
ncbi:hypothetical protein KBD71_05080 [Candidatus Woesebacteria bacterium]|nr:hypothetical protein [Candidatus Woesebacteria bacterium]